MNQKIALSYVIRKRYQQSTKKEKGGILDEFIKNTGYNRSYARRILGSLKKQGRKKKHIIRKSYELKGRSTTKPGTLLRSTIPVRTFSDWD